MITADNITEEAIRELRLALAKELHEGLVLSSEHHHRIAAELGAAQGVRTWQEVRSELDACEAALGQVRNSRRVKGYKRAARARCAEILNARAAKDAR